MKSSSTQLREYILVSFLQICSRRKKLHKYNTGGGSSGKEIPKMSLELSQVTKKHAGDFGPLSRWYFLRVTRCLLRERERKKVLTVICNKTNKQCKNFDFSKNKIPCISRFSKTQCIKYTTCFIKIISSLISAIHRQIPICKSCQKSSHTLTSSQRLRRKLNSTH